MQRIKSASPPPVTRAASQLAATGETVEILVLTGDQELLSTLRAAVAPGGRRIWHAPGFPEAAELIMAGRVGVAVIDALAVGEDTGALCERFRAQFPDLVLIVTGTLEDQTQLVGQITSGDIYRFLHKPLSEARARQFIETSVRRHLDGRTLTLTEAEPALTWLDKPAVWGGAAAFAAALIAVVLFFSRQEEAPRVAAESAITANPALSEVERSTTAAIEAPVPISPDPLEPMASTQPSTSAPSAQPPSSPPPARTSAPPELPEAAGRAAATEPRPNPSTPSVERTQNETPASGAAPEIPVARAAEPATASAPAPLPKPSATFTAPDSGPTRADVPPPPSEPRSAALPKPDASAGGTSLTPEPAATTRARFEAPPPAQPQRDPQAAFLEDIVSATSLPRVRQVDPVYPYRARRTGTEGWVELEFTVDTQGGVKDIEVREAEPRGVFEEVATEALAKWRFEPVLRKGRPTEQRARLRLRFEVEP